MISDAEDANVLQLEFSTFQVAIGFSLCESKMKTH